MLLSQKKKPCEWQIKLVIELLKNNKFGKIGSYHNLIIPFFVQSNFELKLSSRFDNIKDIIQFSVLYKEQGFYLGEAANKLILPIEDAFDRNLKNLLES